MMDKALWPSALAKDQGPSLRAQGSRVSGGSWRFVEENQQAPATERKHNLFLCHNKVSEAGPTHL